MGINSLNYNFITEVARIINSGVSKSIILHGNIQDLFFLPDRDVSLDESEPHSNDDGIRPLLGSYVPLVHLLTAKWQVKGLIQLVYELNGPIRFLKDADKTKVKRAWVAWKSGIGADELIAQELAEPTLNWLIDNSTDKKDWRSISREFEKNLHDAIGNPTVALELLRQFTLCSRSKSPNGNQFLKENLLILIEAADMLIPPAGEISRLAQTDRHRISIIQDWFSDPGFMNGDDSVVLITESKSLINERVSKLPQVIGVESPAPDEETRRHFVSWFDRHPPDDDKLLELWGTQEELVTLTAGLSIHALRQLLVEARYIGKKLMPEDVVAKVEDFIQNQLGEDVVEFKKPEHTLEDLVGFKRLIDFLKNELMPRFKLTGSGALPGAVVGGAIGGGKTYIFEAVAGALGIPVLTLKNIRSMWFGQTDVIFERLKRVLKALGKVLIFVDEADTQFGSIGSQAHETERRLTGKIQAMMSDPKLRGKVKWLLMTARIHLLSPDIRRPGRVGDLIIPVLDPDGEDKKEFLRWMAADVVDKPIDENELALLDKLTEGYSAASFASLRSELIAKLGNPESRKTGKRESRQSAIRNPQSEIETCLTPHEIMDTIVEIVNDHLPPAIGLTRRYQTLQALVNCTRRSLLPDPDVSDEERERWNEEIRELEAIGIT